MAKDKVDELYDALAADGIVTKGRDNFRKFFFAKGDEGYKNRNELYKSLKADGLVESNSYEEFRDKLGLHAVKPAAKPQGTVAAGTPLSDDDKRRMSAAVGGMVDAAKAGNKRAMNRMDYAQANAGIKVKPVKLGENRHVVETTPKYNLETGKQESTYITESGNEFENRSQADLEQNAIDEYKYSQTVEGQLREAEAESERLSELMRQRMEEIDSNREGGLLRELADESHGMPGGMVNSNGMNDYRTDERFLQLEAAARKNRLAIQTLKDKRDGKMNDFWHSLGTAMLNGYTLSDGLSDMNDATAVLSAQKRLDAINRKREAGQPLTKEEEAAEAVLRNFAINEQIQGQYGGEYGAWSRAGSMAATSIDLMKDIMLTPGAGSIAKGVAAKTAQTLGKGVSKVAGEKVANNIITKGILKGTGILVGAHTAGAVVSNTGGIGHTGAAMGREMAGNVTIDDNGNYGIENQKDLLNAFVEAERQQAGENGSEMFGEFIPGAGGLVKKGLEKIGLSKISNALTNIGKKNWYKQYSNLLSSGGYNGIPGEAIEEYEGMLFDAMTGNAGEAWENIKDPRTHIDIWLGCATMGALLGAVPMTVQGAHTAQYYRYKHKADVADKVASYRMTSEKWEPIREQIDMTENGGMTDVVMDIANRDDLHVEEKKAAINYVRNLMKMRGYNIAQANNANEDKDADVETANEEYSEGYGATGREDMRDVKNRYDLHRERVSDLVDDGMLTMLDSDPVNALSLIRDNDAWTDEEKQMLTNYVNAKAAYDGMLQGVRDDIDSRMAQSDAMVDSRVNPADGMLHPAKMKENDREVYVIGGNIVMNDDGTMIDNEKSDESIIVRDAETGKIEFADPRSVLSIDATLDAEQVKQEARENIRQSTAQQAANNIDGILPFNAGDNYTLTDEQGQQHTVTVVPVPEGMQLNDGDVLVSYDGVTMPMPRDYIQNGVENTNLARLTENETERAARLAAEPQGTVTSRPVYSLNDEITLQTDEGPVRGSITAEENEDGLIEVYTERPVGGNKINLYNRGELDGMLIEHNGATLPQSIDPAAKPQGTVDARALGEQQGTVVAQSEVQQVEPMPMVGEGEEAEPDFTQTTPQRAHTYIYNEAGLDRDEANQFVEANKKAADKALSTIQGKKPKMGTSLAKYRKETAEWQQNVAEAQAQADYWKQVKDEQQKILAAEVQARAERDAAIHEQAIAEEQLRQEEELRKREEQAQLGSNNVAPQISEKWNAAPKVEGARNELVLANGEKVAGRYVLVESGAATPSHNPVSGFAKNEGFPVDENEQSVNDRDYERDQDAQAITRQIAGSYDSRALQTPVVVSSDGVVLSGNGRTMAGELAAMDGTDSAYIEHLKKYGEQYGFTPEQIEGMAHPRVLFVPDEAMPYTADTFAKFNQQEMKGQSKTEQAVKLGKIVDDDTFGRIIRNMNAYETLGDFYSDPTASANAIQELLKAGAISQAQYAEMFDGDTISSQGREMLENMLIGKAFESNPDAVREITAYKSMRQSIICALSEISNNLLLGDDYSLESELAQAIELVYKARQAGYKSGERVSSYARQLNLFPFEDGESVADYTNTTTLMLADVLNDSRVTRLKKVLAIYNHNAQDSANGQMNLFIGGVESKEEILNTVKSLLYNGTEEEQQAAISAAVEQRTSAAEQSGTDSGVQQDGVSDGRSGRREDAGGSGGSSEETQRLNHDEAITLIAQMEERAEVAPQIELTIENWDAQFGEDGRVNTPIGEVKMGENQFAKLMRQGREGKLGMIKPTLESPDVIIEDVSKAKDGDTTERNSSYIFVKAFKKADGSRYYYFTSITVNKDGHEVVVSSQEKSRNRLLRLMTEGKMLWRTPKDATTASAEQQGLDYVQPLETETATKGSGITPQSTDMSSSDGKGTKKTRNNNELDEKNAEKGEKSTSVAKAEAETEQNPTDGQKEAGNYKKGHVKIDGLDISIENPKGSERSGTDASGKPWSVTMNNTYGYIRRTEGVDGDHIDVFLSDHLDDWNGTVYVVDQINENGSFDEHKVMYGFNSEEEARDAYLSNYAEGWQGLGTITGVTKDEFKKWIDSSHRKTKAFAEYKGVKAVENDLTAEEDTLSLADAATVTDIAQVNEKAKTEDVSTETPEHKSKWVDDEDAARFEELKRRMRMKIGGQMNMGVDPEILAIGTEMAFYVIKHGARQFGKYASAMIDELGDAIRPYLKSFYNGARDFPEMESYAEEMTPYDEVRAFDVANFDKSHPDAMATAEQVVAEQEAEKQAAEAVGKIKEIAKKDRKRTKKQKNDVPLHQEADLFGSLSEENNNVEQPNNTNNGLQRNDAVRSEGLPADNNHRGEQTGRMGETPRQESDRTDRGGQESRGGGLRPDVHDGLRLDEQLSPTSEELDTPANPKNTKNNHAERGTDYAPKAVDARIQANIRAIELMQELVETGEKATPEQMAVLRQFSGWGGLGKAFDNNRAANNGKSISQYLKELLGDEAYQQANMSRNSAYYTPANVIDALWDIARAMGFKGDKVLEGSAGIGNILGLMPTDMSERSDIHAVEIDGTTGNILSLLYPDAQVDVQGFEATPVENGSIDLAITNVPFVTGLRVNDTTGDKDLSRKFRDIHDFCIAKNIRKLRDGGIGIFITSSGTLDNSTRLREWIVGEGAADVVGAFRLNNETFGGTGATSDIIVVRKRVNGRQSPHAIDVSHTTGERVAEYDTGEMKKVKGVEAPIIKQLTMDYNQYFVEHPEMMAGKMLFGFEKGDTFRPTSKALYPVKGKNQDKMLSQWADSFAKKEWEVSSNERSDKPANVYEKLGDGVKEGSMVVDGNGVLCIAQRGEAVPLSVNANKVKGHSKAECFQAYKAIKDALSDVLEYQTTHDDNAGLQPLLDRLNKAFDSFVQTYGHLHKNPSISFLKNDVDFANILALEKFSERADVSGKRIQEYGKTDIFSRRVVEKEKAPEPKNVKDGIIASIYVYGRIDVPYISEHLGMSEDKVKAEIIKSGLGFENPVSRQMEVSYEYLSGNVREKLQQAMDNNQDGRYNANIKALEKVIPMNIPAHLIDFNLGSSWIAPKLYEEYVKEKTDVDVTFAPVGGTWLMKAPHFIGEQKNRAMGVKSNMFNRTIMGTQLIEAAMQNRTITISETHKRRDGSTETITDKEATQACANKIDEIRQDFKDWARAKMQSYTSMAENIERIYNDMFNNYVPKNIPDEFVPQHFSGQVTELDGKPFSLRPHQGKAVVRGTTQPLLLAHEVGTGKTYTLISTAMEMRRLGTARKPMIVVQNSTVGQFVESAKEIYPNAKVLTLEDKDHTSEGRKNFYAKIKYNDWDMIVVPQSVFERIPDSEERQMKFVHDKIEEKMLALEQMREAANDDNSPIVRQAEREISKLEDELAALTNSISNKRKERDEKKEAVTRQNAEVKALEMLDRAVDDVENFDDMGVDAILVDEAHEYKHLGFATAMQRGVKGVDPSYSKKAQGVYLKAQAVLEKNHGRNVIFATGTPISNTAAEIWTFMRYLMPADTMKEYDIYYFDDFVRNFGNLAQMLEFTTSGKFKENNRFAGYVNLPELVRIWSSVSDTVLTREAGGVKDKIPHMEGDKAQDIYLPQTRALRSVMKFVKKQLNDYDKMSGKQKKENGHIPLTMYGIAKAAAVDARLVVTDAADEPQSKTNEAVRQILRSLEDTASYNGTVALFADNYQNKNSGFNLYEDIREKLIAAGVPEEQIVIMKSGMSVKKKLEIFDKVNRGEVRVIMGSTFTLGTGVNIQERLHTLIHLDAPNRPMDYTQRNGRILRQGNIHKDMGLPVRVLRFGVEDSLDVTAYQRLKTKGAIADSIMNGKQMMQNSMENRALEEEEDVFGDTVAQLSGSEYAMLKNQAEKDVRKYTSKKKQWEDDQTYCHNEIPRLESQIKELQSQLDASRKSLATVEGLPEEKPITIGKQTFTTIESMADFLKDYNKKIKEVENELRDNPSIQEQERRLTVNVGGIDFAFRTVLNIETRQEQGTLFSAVHRKMTYSCETLGLEDVPVRQSLLREGIEDIVSNIVTGNDFREDIERFEINKAKAEKTLSQIKERDGKPFEFSKELEQAKERFEEYSELMKKELEEKEAKYADMDAEVEELDSDEITVAEEASEEEADDDETRLREGDDVEPMSYEESLRSARRAGYTKRQHDAMLSRQWRHMREQAENAISRLGLTGRVTVLETAEGLKGRKARAKGWYDAKTGKIVVVMSNHHGPIDIMRTILHEGVAHYGLRALFGSNFDRFLDNVFQYADASVRSRIVGMAKRHGWDFRVATEEYLASLAEDTDFERADRQDWWSRIKSFFLDMLHSIGLDYGGAILTDNELRYILWRSYENLAEPGTYRNPFREAEDISKQMQLKVSSYDRERARIHRLGRFDSSSQVMSQAVVADTGIRFRDGDFSERDRVTARDEYERMIASGLYQFREAVQDSMLSLRKLYEAILGKNKDVHIEDVKGYENAYLAENRMSSTNAAEQHDYYNKLMKPLLTAIGEIAGSKKGARQALTDYMMAKHGLERNIVFAERDAREAEANGADYAEAYAQYREKDYSGLTALTGEDDLAAAEAKAQQIVDDYEAAYDTSDLWSLTREATQATLGKIYKSGMLNRDRYEAIRDMFQYYIPLQGWDETTSDEVYGYLTSKNGLLTGSPIKRAEGRSSKADDPIATIAMMADAAIRQGNRNLMKQRFLNFVLNHPSDLVSVTDLWLQYDAATDEWVPVFADIEEGDTAADVERKVDAFEQRMEQLSEAEPDKYKRGHDAQNIPYKVMRNNLKEHQILVKRDGRTYVLTINGNPRAAQALNGLTNPDVEQSGVVGNMLKAGEYINRQLSAFYTTRNPDFVVSNFLRDMLYSNCMTWVKENPRYALRYHKNFGRLNPVTMRRLLGKWEDGTLDKSNKTEQMFYQFMMNGGETGYTSIRDIEAHKQAIAAELKKQGSVSRRAWSALGMQLDLMNRSVENCARFAAFVTSREMGRSIDRSINDAKEVSVNFNKKGSGGKMVNATGQSLLGKVGSYIGGGGRLLYVFWNAGIQGMTNFGRAGKRHSVKALAGASTMFVLGYLIPQLAAATGGGDGDDDDKNAYYNLPEYIRRSNICFRAGDRWVTIPLPIEFRALYGLGELASGVISGNENYSNNELSYQIASQVSQTLPLDMLEGGGGVSPFIPSTAKPFAEAYIMNKGWTGLPVYKDTPWNQNDPEWTKAYKNADQTLVEASKWLNESTGGDDFKKGVVDINPAKIEYLLSGMFGGYVTTAGKLKKMGETAWGDREFDWRNMLIANRVVKTGDERTANRKLQNEYFKYKKEYDETKRLLNKYDNAADEGIAGMAEKADFLYNSKAYLRYELFDEYESDINDCRDALKEAGDAEEYKAIESEMYAIMRELIDQLHKTEE